MTTATATITKDEAIEMALEIERTEAAVKKMKESLKAYVDANGALQAGDKVWDYSQSVSWSFDGTQLKELAVAITAEGKNAWDFLKLPADSIKKLGWEESALEQYGSAKITNRFSSKKA